MNNDELQGFLLFRIKGEQLFAVSVLKVREILPFRKLTLVPDRPSTVVGSLDVRGTITPIIDVARVMEMEEIDPKDYDSSYIIITEHTKMKVGFLVSKVERIIETTWNSLTASPSSLGDLTFLIGVIQYKNKLVQMIDIELIWAKVYPLDDSVLHPILPPKQLTQLQKKSILIIDDSKIARQQFSVFFAHIGMKFSTAINGINGFKELQRAALEGKPYDIVLSDIEMPEMDGYLLAKNIKETAYLANTFVIVHTSLTNSDSFTKAIRAGADQVLPKYDLDTLSELLCSFVS